MKSVIFDLDGTLADTSGDLIDAANACFRDMGHGDILKYGDDAGIALRGGRAMLTAGLQRIGAFKEDLINQYYPFLLEAYGASLSRHSKLYPDAEAAVRTLIAAGIPVGICTNKPEALARRLLQELGVMDLFAALIGADTLRERKPHPLPLLEAIRLVGGTPAASFLIGDSDTDRNTAAAAGVTSVLVSFGPSGEDMAALRPEYLLHDYRDLPQIVMAHG